MLFVSGDGTCVVHDGYHVETDGLAVTLWMYSRTVAPAGAACPAQLVCESETVVLPLPLDGRTKLIHGEVSPPTAARCWD